MPARSGPPNLKFGCPDGHATRRPSAAPPVASLAGVSLRYGEVLALDDVTLDVPAGRMVGLIGPDGVGKSSLLSLVAGARAAQDGRVTVLGGDMADRRHRDAVCPRIAYMPQGLGRTSTRPCRWKRTCNSSAGCSAMTRPSGAGASTA